MGWIELALDQHCDDLSNAQFTPPFSKETLCDYRITSNVNNQKLHLPLLYILRLKDLMCLQDIAHLVEQLPFTQ